MNKLFAPFAGLLTALGLYQPAQPEWASDSPVRKEFWRDWGWAKQQLLAGRKVRRYKWPAEQFVYNKPDAGLFQNGVGYYHSNDADMKATDWELFNATTLEDLK